MPPALFVIEREYGVVDCGSVVSVHTLPVQLTFVIFSAGDRLKSAILTPVTVSEKVTTISVLFVVVTPTTEGGVVSVAALFV